jgi:uroporphyrinogen-III synthase
LAHLPPARPLAGKRIVVTRAPDQAGELAERLQQAGAVLLEAPAIRIALLADAAPLERALKRLSRDSWVVFTSANAANAFWSHAAARIAFQRGDDGPRVAAIGPATAAALHELGVRVDFVPQRHEGAALAAELPLAPGAHVLLPRSAIGREELPKRLAERGAQVDDVPIYTTEAAPLASSVVDELGRGFDAVTLTSGSTVRSFVAAVATHPSLRRQLENAVIACIGPATAAAAEEAGLRPQVVATEATIRGLVEALAAFYRRI